jgi:hypothetical protein
VLYFKPDEDCGQASLNVLPDFFPPDLVRLKGFSIGDQYQGENLPTNFQIPLMPDQLGKPIYAEFESGRPPYAGY